MYLVCKTKCSSLTGNLLYSDSYVKIDNKGNATQTQSSTLTRWSKVPFVGIVVGITKVGLAAIHITVHLLLSPLNKEHLYHVVKGGAELLRAIIVTIPVVGRIFAWHQDALRRSHKQPGNHYSFFLVKLVHQNPAHWDNIDRAIALQQLDTNEEPSFPPIATPPEKNMTILVTGSNRGIGLGLCSEYSRNSHVIATCRETSDELEELHNENDSFDVIAGVDVTQKKNITDIDVEEDEIDTLILNAGNYMEDNLDTASSGIMSEHFRTHAIGSLNTVQALAGKMKKGGKIVFIVSRMGSMQSNLSGVSFSGGDYAYRAAKAAQISIAVNASIDLRNKDITVLLIHPGYVKTRMTDGEGNITVEQSAKRIATLINALGRSNSGQFFNAETFETVPF